MHSELFSIGPLTLRSFGLCMALGFLLGWQAAVWLCRRTRQDPDRLTSLLTWLMLAAVVGARAAYVLEHWHAEFADNLTAIVRIDQGGLMFYGGLALAAAFLVAYARVTRRPLFEITDLILAVVPVGHAFGRLGCFLHGCCYGKLTSSCIGVRFPKGSPAWWEQVSASPPLLAETAAASLPVIPTQLIESAANLALFALLVTLYPRRFRQRGFISGCYLIGYALLRFGIEFLRGDPRLAVGPFSISQTISLGLLLLGGWCLLRARRAPAAAALAALLLAAAPAARAGADDAPPPLLDGLATNVPYYSASELAGADAYRREQCRLDLRAPTDRPGFATVVWFHGGGLTGGKRHFIRLKSGDVAVAAASYRLSPRAALPAFIEDAAAATAWVLRHIAAYGGDSNLVFVAGHSAGGYLAALVGMDPRWLAARGVDHRQLAGLIPVSGQMSTHFHVKKLLGDTGPQFRPLIDAYAPLYHCASNLPPVCLIVGDRALEFKSRAEENAFMAVSLRNVGHPDVAFHEMGGLDHGAVGEGGLLVLEAFVQEQRKKRRAASR